MEPTLSIVLQLPPSTAYEKLDAVAKNLLMGIGKMLESGKVRFSIFLDGPTLEAAQRVARPLTFGRLRKAVEEGYLEILGGGFLDPMLPLFPTALQSAQLEQHGKLVQKLFGLEPAGYFNSSMVWEMEMTELLEKNRFEYALVQESALQDALGRSTSVSGWYTVEDKGSFLRVVPVSEKLSLAISNDDFNWVEIAEPYCRDGRSAVVVLDIPPKPGDIVPFFERLIDFIETNDVSTKTVGRAISDQNSEGRLSFLLSAGRRIGLPATAKTCRELLVRRPEINLFHKLLLSLFRRGNAGLKDKDRQKFFETLYPAMSPIYYRDMQDSEGMRTPMVRFWGYRFLSEASAFLTETLSFDGIRLELADFLLEGRKLIAAESHSYSFILDYFGGGVFRFLNAKMSSFNVLGSWHDDGEAAVGFQDYLLPNMDYSASKLDQILVDREDALVAPYDYKIKRQEDGSDILLLSEQPINRGEEQGILHVEKNFALSSDGSDFTLTYHLQNAAEMLQKGFFGSLMETGLAACERGDGVVLVDGEKLKFDFTSPMIYPEAKTLEIVDSYTSCHMHLEFDKLTNILLSPIFGASSASAAPDALQGVRVFPFWKVALGNQDVFDVNVKVRFSRR